MSTPYTLSMVESKAMKNDPTYQSLVNYTRMVAQLNTRLASLNTSLTTAQAACTTVAQQILAARVPTVSVPNGTPIAVQVNKDGSVTLNVG